MMGIKTGYIVKRRKLAHDWGIGKWKRVSLGVQEYKRV